MITTSGQATSAGLRPSQVRVGDISTCSFHTSRMTQGSFLPDWEIDSIHGITSFLSLSIPGWTQNVDYARTKDAVEAGTRFKTKNTKLQLIKSKCILRFNSGSGIYTPIVAGYYHVCSYARSRTPSLYQLLKGLN